MPHQLNYFTTFLLILCIAGCQPANPMPSPDTSQTSALPRPSPADLVTVETVQSSLDPDVRPKTPDDLVKMFVEQYRANPETAFVNLYDWGELPQDKRIEILAGLLTYAHPFDGSKTYPLIEEETRLLTVEEYSREGGDMTAAEYNEGLSVPCTHVLDVAMKMGENTTSYANLDIGTRDGVYYFYANWYIPTADEED